MQKIKLVLTGGHAGSTAYAVVEALREDKTIDWDLVFIGAKSAVEGSKVKTFEHKVFNKIGVPFYSLTAGKVQTKFTRYTIPALLKIPIGLFQAFILLRRLKPNLVISFGGYAALPVVLSASFLRIPIILHEQTAAAGRANEMGSKFATKILLARSSSLQFFPNEKCVVVGNPISSDILSIKPKVKLDSEPVLLITGGSRGSTLINEAIIGKLPSLLEKFKIIHQTGDLDFQKVNDIRNKLPEGQKTRYEVHSFIEPWEWKKLFEKADIVVSRAGANTVSELIYTKRPSVLIPLKYAYKNEQLENAKYARDFGLSVIIEEKDLSGDILLKCINQLVNDFDQIVKKVENKESPDANASLHFVNLIKTLI